MRIFAFLLIALWQQQPSSDAIAIQSISQSGRCAVLAESADERVSDEQLIAPGEPPLLSFRYYEGQTHRRYGNADLMLDDAGH